LGEHGDFEISEGIFTALLKSKERRYPRIATPTGVWAQWQEGEMSSVSRVQGLNAGGAFIATLAPLKVGTSLKVLLSVHEGEIRAQAIVRDAIPGEGMGVEFVSMENPDWQRLLQLVQRLTEKPSPTEA
jgi:hypothetical protein